MGREISKETVRGMVATLRPAWNVEAVEWMEGGTDSVALVTVATPEGCRRLVCKAATADHVPLAAARAEPRLLERVGTETEIPVPTVYGYCDSHPEFPTPFYLQSYVDGEFFEGITDDLEPTTHEGVIVDAGRHLAALNDLQGFDAVGRLGFADGRLRPLDVTHDPPADTRQWALGHAEETLDELLDGGYFSHLAEQPDRFADLVPDLRAYCRERVPELPNPDDPRLSHTDYRLGNLVVDTDADRVEAVLDWGNVMACEPAYALATVESMLLSPERDSSDRTTELRELFQQSYDDARSDWSFTPERRERMDFYRLIYRLNSMACLPLWHSDSDERDRYEQLHREFVGRYLDRYC